LEDGDGVVGGVESDVKGVEGAGLVEEIFDVGDLLLQCGEVFEFIGKGFVEGVDEGFGGDGCGDYVWMDLVCDLLVRHDLFHLLSR